MPGGGRRADSCSLKHSQRRSGDATGVRARPTNREELGVRCATIQALGSETKRARVTARARLRPIAAANFTQRMRTMLARCHTGRVHSAAAAGRVNRLE
jgi:hypothetical protein